MSKMTRDELEAEDKRMSSRIMYYDARFTRMLAREVPGLDEDVTGALYALSGILDRMAERADDDNAELLYYLKYGTEKR